MSFPLKFAIQLIKYLNKMQDVKNVNLIELIECDHKYIFAKKRVLRHMVHWLYTSDNSSPRKSSFT